MTYRRLTLAAAVVMPMLAAPAIAQVPPDAMAMMHSMGYNQLGVIEYCQSHGWVDQATIDDQKKVLATLPPGSTPDADAAAETIGKTGTVSANGTQVTLASAASQKGTTEAAMCQQMGSTIKSAVSQSAGAGMPGGNMPAMPSMPSGGMPTMPNMPPQQN